MRVIYRGSLPHATELLAGFKEGDCSTGGFKKFLNTLQVRLPKKIRFVEFCGEFEFPTQFIDRLKDQGLEGELQACMQSLLHIRTPWRNGRKNEAVMWFVGLPYPGDGDSLRKAGRYLADSVILKSANNIEVRTPKPDEQRDYEIHMKWIVKAAHPNLRFNSLTNFLPLSFRASREYSSIDDERKLDITFNRNTQECIEKGEKPSIIRVAEDAIRGHGYIFARDLAKGCIDSDIFHLSYKKSGSLQRLNVAV